MPSAPSGPFVKLVRAHRQLRGVEKLYAAWQAKEPYRMHVKHDSERGVYIYRLKQIVVAPAEIEILIDEAIYHMRSSLDHIVCGLVPGSTRGRGFPLFTEDPELTPPKSRARAAWHSQTRGLSEDALKLVVAFQPYQAGPLADEQPLARLNQLSILYKHVSVEQVEVRIVGPGVPGLQVMGERLEDGSVFAIVPDNYDRRDIDPHLQIFPSFNVSGPQSDGGLYMGIDRLREIHTYLCVEVLPAFAPLFD